jgi:cystathionine beta-lyase
MTKHTDLVVPADPAAYRTAVPWEACGYLLRYHVGLEDPADLISDLAEGFQRLH